MVLWSACPTGKTKIPSLNPGLGIFFLFILSYYFWAAKTGSIFKYFLEWKTQGKTTIYQPWNREYTIRLSTYYIFHVTFWLKFVCALQKGKHQGKIFKEGKRRIHNLVGEVENSITKKMTLSRIMTLTLQAINEWIWNRLVFTAKTQ